MQNVAWPTMIVSSPNVMPKFWKVVWSASPVMIPGSAIGRMTMNETVSRPKKLYRETPSESSVPSDHRDERREKRSLYREPERLPDRLVLVRDPEPLRAPVLDRPALRDLRVERVEADHDERRVEEGERRRRAEPQEDPRGQRLDHQRFSKAPSFRATER